MVPSIVLTLGSMPLSAAYLRAGAGHARVLLFLYVCVAGAMLTWLSLPSIDWIPSDPF